MNGKLTTKGKPSGPVLRILIKFTVFVVFALTLVFAAIYCAGSYHKFPDSSQFAVVRLILVFSVLLGISSLCGALFDIACAVFYRQAAPLAGTLGYVALLLLGVFFAAGAGFILNIAGGNL
jgi:hypothetical protein